MKISSGNELEENHAKENWSKKRKIFAQEPEKAFLSRRAFPASSCY